MGTFGSQQTRVGAGKSAGRALEAGEESLREVKRNAQRAKRSAIARGRLRDEQGHFLSKGVAMKIGCLETELNDSRSECNALREEVKRLQSQLWQLQGGPLQGAQRMGHNEHPGHPGHPGLGPGQCLAPPVARSFMPLDYSQSLQHKYTPGSYRSVSNEEPFREKIDFSKVALRKTNSGFMTPEEREFYLNQQLQWEIGQGVNDIRRKADEQMRVYHDLPPPDSAYCQFVGPVHPGHSNAHPSSVFSQPNKSGNVLLPAFREKVDLVRQANQLRKIDAAYQEHLMQAQMQQQQAQMQQQRAQMQQAQMQHQRAQMHQQRRNSMLGLNQSGSYPPMSPDFSWDGSDAGMSPHPDEMQVQEHTHPRFGGPPSDIYTPPEKIGNRQVAAFTEKVNFAAIQLNKTASPFSSPSMHTG